MLRHSVDPKGLTLSYPPQFEDFQWGENMMVKTEYLIVPKGTKLTGSGKLGLKDLS